MWHKLRLDEERHAYISVLHAGFVPKINIETNEVVLLNWASLKCTNSLEMM